LSHYISPIVLGISRFGDQTDWWAYTLESDFIVPSYLYFVWCY
jgi:hypothetical protein